MTVCASDESDCYNVAKNAYTTVPKGKPNGNAHIDLMILSFSANRHIAFGNANFLFKNAVFVK